MRKLDANELEALRLKVAAAAVWEGKPNRAWKRGEIERQYHIQAIKAGTKDPMGEPLEPGQWASMLNVASPHIARMIMLGLGTGARPEAVCELTWDRVDLKSGLIILNPREREQTKKHRPIVRIPPTLREWLEGEKRDGEHVVQFRGQPTRRYHDSWKRTRTKAEISERVTRVQHAPHRCPLVPL